MARTAASILKQVALSEHYKKAVHEYELGMCYALTCARVVGDISLSEYSTATRHVRAYLESFPGDRKLYLHNRLPEEYLRDDLDYTYIYTDWANRPRPQE